MYNQLSEDDDTSSPTQNKTHAIAAAVEAADARTMEKFTHVADMFVQKSIAAALSPYKQAVLRFAQVQLDTVRRALCGQLPLLLFVFTSVPRSASDLRLMAPKTHPGPC
jgi:hypothetical protein